MTFFTSAQIKNEDIVDAVEYRFETIEKIEEIEKEITHSAVSVVVVEDAESDCREDAGEVEEEGGGEHLLRRLVAGDAVRVVGHVVGQPPLQIVVDALSETPTFLLLLLIQFKLNPYISIDLLFDLLFELLFEYVILLVVGVG